MTETSPSQYFSSTYRQAREKFFAAAGAANAEMVNYENQHRDADGERLFTDVALSGLESAKSALVLCSGTHGVEGFCGSGIQAGLLSTGIAERLPPDIRLVLIHALNPFGFSHLRRVNEDNVDVDLNRNFVDHSRPYSDNQPYDALHKAINPRTDSRLTREWAFFRLLCEMAIRGLKPLKIAISEGQYRHPKGLFFGGSFETWSNQTLGRIAKQHFGDCERVAFIDIHTGLGPHGHGELISRFPSESPTYARMTSWWGARVVPDVDSDVATASLSGTATLAISQIFPNAEVTPATLEFGTVGPITVLRAMQVENWMHHHGISGDAKYEKAKMQMKQVFYPSSEAWKRGVWNQGIEVVDQTIAGLSSASSVHVCSS